MWNRTWGYSGHESAMRISINENGTSIYTGFVANNDYALLLKYDALGNNLWNKTWKKGNSSAAWGIATDNENHIFVSADSDSGGEIYGFNDSGSLNWSKPYNGYISSITASNDSIYAVGGYNDDAQIIKYDFSGNEIWKRVWKNGQYSALNQLCIGFDNISIYGTGITGPKFGIKDVLVLAYDSLGNHLWNKTWGGALEDAGSGIATDVDDNIFICGGTESFGSGITDAFLIKFNSSGVFQWYKTWGGSGDDFGLALQYHNNSIYLAGYAAGPSSNHKVLLIKYNLNGDLIWNTTYYEGITCGAWGLSINKNGEIFLSGGQGFSGSGKALLLKYIEIPNGTPELMMTLIPVITLMGIFIIIIKHRKKKAENRLCP